MECDTCRIALSARLDGEERPAERAAVDKHLAGCDECRQWFDEAGAITGLFRTGVADDPGSGVSEVVLRAAPGRRLVRLASGLRWVLGAFGVAQLVLGVLQVTTLASGYHMHAGEIAAPGHLWHESAAWNLALGVGFVWIAVRGVRPGGVAPILTVFVVVLGVLSIADVVDGQVQPSWLLSHGFLLGGYAVILLLSHPAMVFDNPPGRGGRLRPGRYSPAGADHPGEAPVYRDPQAPAAAPHHAA